MQKRILGKNGPELTVLGFGAWAIGGPWQKSKHSKVAVELYSWGFETVRLLAPSLDNLNAFSLIARP